MSASDASDIAAASRGLDHLNLFVANIQTGFGPFIAIYLASQGWTQTGIGLALSLGTAAAMASQIPAGALVDALHSKVHAARIGIASFTLCALIFAFYPVQLFVYIAEILHAFASCMLGPAIAAISLAVAGQHALGLRLGRNARYASIGNAIGAALMGACGYYLSDRSIFFLTALLTLPAWAFMQPLSRLKAPRLAAKAHADEISHPKPIMRLLKDRRLFVFASCVALFTFGNAATLPLVSAALNKSVGNLASLTIAACIVLPQIIVAVISPAIGRLAENRGRRLVLAIGLAALPCRCLIFALLLGHPSLVVMAQALDGIAGAAVGVLVPLVTSDIAGHSGHFNLTLGFIGFFMGIGGTLSTGIGGWMADRLGDPVALLGLGAIGLLAVLLALVAMPETRPEDESA
ncbi:MAG TPA: MFS transporter [Stellaceae bacterium]|nr:MFS transporter [Stellaceae bacterium]